MLIEYKTQEFFPFRTLTPNTAICLSLTDIDVPICASDVVVNELDPDDHSDFLNWFESLHAGKRIFVPGNHELVFSIVPKWGKLIFQDRGTRSLA